MTLSKEIPQEHLKQLFRDVLEHIEISPVGVGLAADNEQSALFLRYVGTADTFGDSYLITELLHSINEKLRDPIPPARVEALVRDKLMAALIGTTVGVVTENMETLEDNVVKLTGDDDAQTKYLDGTARDNAIGAIAPLF